MLNLAREERIEREQENHPRVALVFLMFDNKTNLPK